MDNALIKNTTPTPTLNNTPTPTLNTTTHIPTFVRTWNSPAQLTRFCAILHVAARRGALVVADTRARGCTMRECVAWLTENLRAAGVRVAQVPYKDVWPALRTDRVVFWYGNLWAMVADRGRAERVKSSPWVALQTEHKGHRVYEQPKCHYRWFLRACDQVWDFGFDYCEGTRSLYLPHMWTLRRHTAALPTTALPTTTPSTTALAIPSPHGHAKPFDACLLGKDSPERSAVKQAIRAHPAGLKAYFADGLTPEASRRVLGQSAVGLMVPRQAGNLEIHRFATLVASGCVVVCPALPPGTPRAQELHALFAPAIDFVGEGGARCVGMGNAEGIASRIAEYKADRRAWLLRCLEAERWYEAQGLGTLLRQVRDLCGDIVREHAGNPLPHKPSPQRRPQGTRPRAGLVRKIISGR